MSKLRNIYQQKILAQNPKTLTLSPAINGRVNWNLQSYPREMDIEFEEQKLKSLQISCLSEEENEGGAPDDDVEDADSDEFDDEEDEIPMTLGFVEKPKNPWSSRRQYFPSKAGGSPVI